jgi:hypothetical protein
MLIRNIIGDWMWRPACQALDSDGAGTFHACTQPTTDEACQAACGSVLLSQCLRRVWLNGMMGSNDARTWTMHGSNIWYVCVEAFGRSLRCTVQQQTETGSDVRGVARSAGGVEENGDNAL